MHTFMSAKDKDLPLLEYDVNQDIESIFTKSNADLNRFGADNNQALYEAINLIVDVFSSELEGGRKYGFNDKDIRMLEKALIVATRRYSKDEGLAQSLFAIFKKEDSAEPLRDIRPVFFLSLAYYSELSGDNMLNSVLNEGFITRHDILHIKEGLAKRKSDFSVHTSKQDLISEYENRVQKVLDHVSVDLVNVDLSSAGLQTTPSERRNVAFDKDTSRADYKKKLRVELEDSDKVSTENSEDAKAVHRHILNVIIVILV